MADPLRLGVLFGDVLSDRRHVPKLPVGSRAGRERGADTHRVTIAARHDSLALGRSQRAAHELLGHRLQGDQRGVLGLVEAGQNAGVRAQ